MDRVGSYTFSLRPRTEKYAHRLLCEVSVEDNVKVVTLRSTFLVENKTLYPLEITLVDANGQPVHSLEKIGMFSLLACIRRDLTAYVAPGQDYALPIDAALYNRLRVQPDRKLLFNAFDLHADRLPPQRVLGINGLRRSDGKT